MRPERLARLVAIRRLAEDLDRRMLAQALGEVAEVERAMLRERASLDEARGMARAGLMAGDRGECLLAEAQAKVVGWNRGRLRGLLEVRSGAVAPAMEKFLESRLEHEQVKQLVEDAQREVGIEEDRRAQAGADDWFLARRMRAEE
jgi:hypothetical protein